VADLGSQKVVDIFAPSPTPPVRPEIAIPPALPSTRVSDPRPRPTQRRLMTPSPKTPLEASPDQETRDAISNPKTIVGNWTPIQGPSQEKGDVVPMS
jgi:hypothetical protein